MRVLISLVFLALGVISSAKEYKNFERYKISTGNESLDRKDWLASDREKNTFQWENACRFNFSYAGGHKEYETVEQRQKFLEWLAPFLSEQGHQLKWVKTNVVLFGLLEDALEKNTSSKIKNMIRTVNGPVFDRAFKSLQDVHSNGYILRSNEAKEYDKDLYEYEHSNFYQFHLTKLSADDLIALNKVMHREGITRKGALPEALELDGNIQDYTDRMYWITNKVQPYAMGKRPTDAELSARRAAKKAKSESLKQVDRKSKAKKVKKEKVEKINKTKAEKSKGLRRKK
tara:strand:- start:6398 stop:7258 length:861 start_codon:yes stop_codon:yes gene_type:complete